MADDDPLNLRRIFDGVSDFWRSVIGPDYDLDERVGQRAKRGSAARWSKVDWGELEEAVRVVAHLGQVDELVETIEDGNRCGAAACVSAHILVHGPEKFPDLAQRLGLVGTELTYRNAALAQERLYDAARAANPTAGPGLRLEYRYQKVLWWIVNIETSGSLVTALETVGLEPIPLLSHDGDERQDLHELLVDFAGGSRFAIAAVFGHPEPKTGRFVPGSPQNHIVLVIIYCGALYYVDSGRPTGEGDSIEPLDGERLAQLARSDATLLGVFRAR